MSYNRFKNNYYYNKSKPIIKPSFKMNINEYPELNNNISKNNNNNEFNNNNNFANAILKSLPIDDNNEILKPGYISIKNVNNKFIYNYGANTINNKIKLESFHPNILMDNIITEIVENRERYKKQFNEINGEYAFEDLYDKYSNFDSLDELEDYDLTENED